MIWRTISVKYVVQYQVRAATKWAHWVDIDHHEDILTMEDAEDFVAAEQAEDGNHDYRYRIVRRTEDTVFELTDPF